MPDYKRPPLIEAVIEVRFDKKLTPKNISNIVKKSKQEYPLEKINRQIISEFIVSAQGVVQNNNIIEGRILDKIDLNQQSGLIIMPSYMAVVNRAPYQGWENLFSLFDKAWGILKKESEMKGVTRIGARFVNRIDIPVDDDTQKINIADYLNIGIHTPDGQGIKGYNVNFSLLLSDGFSANIITTTVEPILINTAALLLDIDIYKDSNIPYKDEDLFSMINSIRERKNSLFESYITDEARKIFNRDIK